MATTMIAIPVSGKLMSGETAFALMAFEFFTPGLSRLLAGAEFAHVHRPPGCFSIDAIKGRGGDAGLA